MNLTHSCRWQWQAWSAGMKVTKAVLTVSMRLASPLSARCANTGNSAPWMSDTSVTCGESRTTMYEAGLPKGSGARHTGLHKTLHHTPDTSCCRATQGGATIAFSSQERVQQAALQQRRCLQRVGAHLIVVPDVGTHPCCKVKALHLPQRGATASHVMDRRHGRCWNCMLQGAQRGTWTDRMHASADAESPDNCSVMHTPQGSQEVKPASCGCRR